MADDSRPGRDRLDTGEPGTKAWEEFSVQFSGVRLLSLLLSEIPNVAPEFFEDIKASGMNAVHSEGEAMS